jgi:polyferredoxin
MRGKAKEGNPIDGRDERPPTTEDGRPLVRLPVPGRKMPLLVPKRALVTSITLIVLLLVTGIAHAIVSESQEDAAQDIGGLPIGERTEWSLSYCLRVDPQRVEAEPGQNITFVLQWRAFHYDCPYWLPYGRSVEGVIVNTNISYINLVLIEEGEWEPVDKLHETFNLEVTVQATSQDGYVRLFRECPWYFDQKARGYVDVPDDKDPSVEEKREETLPVIWEKVQRSPLATLFVIGLFVGVPLIIARRRATSVLQLRGITQMSFFGAINLGAFGFWAIRTDALPLTAALPSTACNYLDYNVGACIVYQLQHYFSVGIFESWMFIVVLVLSFLVLYVALGRAWCGWCCPIGMVQGMLSWTRKPLRISRYRLSPFQRQVLNVSRYSIFFGGLVLSIAISISIVTFYINVGDVYRPICQVCPAYPLFTLGVLGAFLFSSVKVRRPFCRICPIAVAMMPFSKVAGVSLHKDPKKCTRCSMCNRVCPVDVTEVWKEMDRTDVTVHNCILCMRCVEVCPEDGCLTGRVLGFNMIESSYRKFLRQHDRRTRGYMVRHSSPWWGGGPKEPPPPGGEN